MADHAELIARLEKADGPDRVLDYDIAMHLNRPFGAWDSFRKYDAAFPTYTRRDAPSFTASIDAALTLVPERAIWKLFSDWPGNFYFAEVVVDRYLPEAGDETYRSGAED